jgi:SDR family mycofactocin-dependent oxidoreductase
MPRLQDKVAFITGAARGLGRTLALTMAREGANVILVDIATPPAGLDYPAATAEDLDETVRQVEALDRRAVWAQADVRDLSAMQDVIDRGVSELGRLDIVVGNAGIVTWGRFWEMDPARWQDVIDINLTGVFNTMRVAAPAMIAAENGGSIIVISSVAGVKSLPGQAHYSAAKRGVVGLADTAAIELAPYRIRVNTVHPWGIETHMGSMSPSAQKIFADNPSYQAAMGQMLFDPPISQPQDVANAVLFLASDESRTITATQLAVDHGASKI